MCVGIQCLYRVATDLHIVVCWQVFDSPVDWEGVPRGFANVLASSVIMKTAIQNSIETYLKVMHNSVTKYYLQVLPCCLLCHLQAYSHMLVTVRKYAHAS